MKTKTKLPKWFLDQEPTLYERGFEVQNPFSGERYTLDAHELTMYDYIIGLQWVIEKAGGVFDTRSFPHQKNLRRSLDWFRRANPEAYQVLLD